MTLDGAATVVVAVNTRPLRIASAKAGIVLKPLARRIFNLIEKGWAVMAISSFEHLWSSRTFYHDSNRLSVTISLLYWGWRKFPSRIRFDFDTIFYQQ